MPIFFCWKGGVTCQSTLFEGVSVYTRYRAFSIMQNRVSQPTKYITDSHCHTWFVNTNEYLHAHFERNTSSYKPLTWTDFDKQTCWSFTYDATHL